MGNTATADVVKEEGRAADDHPRQVLSKRQSQIEEETKMEELFGKFSLEEFIERWVKLDDNIPQWWGISLFQTLTDAHEVPISDAQAMSMDLGNASVFWRGMKKATGSNEDVLQFLESMFPMVTIDQVDIRIAFVFWATTGIIGPAPSNVSYQNIRPFLASRLRMGFRRIFFDEPILEFPSIDSRVLKNNDHWALSFFSETTRWDRLYSSAHDGRSFARLVQGILKYAGPSMVVFTTDIGAILGGVNLGQWEDRGGAYTTFGAFLFVHHPSFSVFSSTGNSTNYTYLNQRNKYVPVGLGFGGQVDCQRLWIDQDFNGHFLNFDATFAKGRISDDNDDFQVTFSVENMEVWGIAGQEALVNQDRQRKFQNDLQIQRRKIDRARFAEGFDREMFLGTTFGISDEAKAEVERHRAEKEDHEDV